MDVVETFFPANTKDFWRWGNGIRKDGVFVRRPSMRPIVVLELFFAVAIFVWLLPSSVEIGLSSSSLSLCVLDALLGDSVFSLLDVSLLGIAPKEKFPGNTNKNFPLFFSKFGTTQADLANWISCPLQVCCNREPGRKADASLGKIGGCEVAGQSEGRTTGSTGGADGAFFLFRFDKEDVVALTFVLLDLEDEDGVDLTLVLRLAATGRFVAFEDDIFFFVLEDGAMLGLVMAQYLTLLYRQYRNNRYPITKLLRNDALMLQFYTCTDAAHTLDTKNARQKIALS